MVDYPEFRLPRTVVPSHYDLLIQSDLKALHFAGVVTASFKVVDSNGISEIVLNAGPKMKLGKAIVVCEQLKTESTQTIDSVALDAKRERATIKLATSLPAGVEGKLTIAFESELDNSMMVGVRRVTIQSSMLTLHHAGLLPLDFRAQWQEDHLCIDPIRGYGSTTSLPRLGRARPQNDRRLPHDSPQGEHGPRKHARDERD